ncbi:MAG: phosphoribosyl-ATP diphosphatase [Myxococcales bacterium]|nr:phosphoribosyl-ATP diphosphatase [Myxococcales bacterium]
MIVPSIDIQRGHAVQLVGGARLEIDAGEPGPFADRFALAGEVAVIDLDAAMGTGDNRDVVLSLLKRARCRVGGGIRDADAALRWLDAGAERVILGTAATPEVLRRLPRERVIAALDARAGEVMTHGWQTRSGRRLEDRIDELAPHVGGFLVTFIEREGRMTGVEPERIAALVARAGDVRVTYAGGVTSPDDVAVIDRLGADCQVGMALYSGALDLGDAIAAPLRSDRPDGLYPTIVSDEHGRALGLCWSSRESLREAVRARRGVYHSRTRGLWHKGASSGDTQELLSVRLDCDRDAVAFVVRQHGRGFCHLGCETCFGPGPGLPALERTIAARRRDAPPGSYTRRLLDDPGLLAAKLTEEAGELARAITPDEVTWEAADLLYFTLVKLAAAGVRLADVEAALARRTTRQTRRPGDAKPQ